MSRTIAQVFCPILILVSAGLLSGACRDPGDRQRRPGEPAPPPRSFGAPLIVPEVSVGVSSAPGIALPPPAGLGDRAARLIVVNAHEYSLDYARRVFLPDMGGSVAVGDYDGDGQPDLYVVAPGGSNHLFRGNPDGSFTDVTKRAGLAGNRSDLAAAFADYDHSGRQSLFVAGLGGIRLYRNDGGGAFSERTREARLDGRPSELYTRALLADIDNDGFPDLIATAYTDLGSPPSKATFAFPNDFSGAQSRLYRNRGDGTFADVTAAAGLAGNPGRGRTAVFADFSRTGRPDLLLLREERPPALYANLGGGKFEERTWQAGEPLTRNAFVDAQVADFNQDGWLDIALWSTMGNRVVLNCGDGKFEQADQKPLIASPATPFGFHGTVADLDGDGIDDVLALDAGGALRIFINRAGRFQEAAFTAQGDLRGPFDWIAPVGLQDRRNPDALLALNRQGQVMLVRRKPITAGAQKP